MDKRRVLVIDVDPDTLITLQHLLEEADLGATITRDKLSAVNRNYGDVFSQAAAVAARGRNLVRRHRIYEFEYLASLLTHK